MLCFFAIIFILSVSCLLLGCVRILVYVASFRVRVFFGIFRAIRVRFSISVGSRLAFGRFSLLCLIDFIAGLLFFWYRDRGWSISIVLGILATIPSFCD